jgi:hypothetical protein
VVLGTDGGTDEGEDSLVRDILVAEVKPCLAWSGLVLEALEAFVEMGPDLSNMILDKV